ncbi:MAG TPA: hypothetical protein VFF73_32145 [Planctomycetota bacterium]|nr:hypothetical protein [Planctomycetota bacterium]
MSSNGQVEKSLAAGIHRDHPDFYFLRAQVNGRAGLTAEALEDLVRGLVVTEDLDMVKRSVAVVARIDALRSARTWVWLAYGSIRARALGDAARERRFLLAALKVAREESVFFVRLARLDVAQRRVG